MSNLLHLATFQSGAVFDSEIDREQERYNQRQRKNCFKIATTPNPEEQQDKSIAQPDFSKRKFLRVIRNCKEANDVVRPTID